MQLPLQHLFPAISLFSVLWLNRGIERHLPPQEEGHDDQDDAETAEDNAHQDGQIVIIMRLS